MAYQQTGRPDSQLARAAAVVALLLLAVAMGITAARAASLGELQVISQLGQPFHARIEVAAASRHELDTLGARLASDDAYRQAGLSYAPALQSLRFELARLKGGRYAIEVRSAQPLREPVVDLLVELAWFEGTSSYAYTALIDPAGSPTGASAVEPFAKYESAGAAGPPSARSKKPRRSTLAAAASAAKRNASIARQIKQKEELLATYKHRLAAAQERISELQWTAREQEKVLAALAADAIVRDMRAAPTPKVVRVSHESSPTPVAAPSAGNAETPGDSLYVGGGMAALLLATLALMRRRRRVGDISGQH